MPRKVCKTTALCYHRGICGFFVMQNYFCSVFLLLFKIAKTKIWAKNPRQNLRPEIKFWPPDKWRSYHLLQVGDGSSKRPQFGARYLTEETDVFKHNAWDDVEWDEEQEKLAQEMVEKNSTKKFTLQEVKSLTGYLLISIIDSQMIFYLIWLLLCFT